MAEFFYGKSWQHWKHYIIDPLTPAKALKLHKAGKKYTVIVGSETHPSHYLTIDRSMEYIAIFKLDEFLRKDIYVGYAEKSDGMMQVDAIHIFQHRDEDPHKHNSFHSFPGKKLNYAGYPNEVAVNEYDGVQYNKEYSGGVYDRSIHDLPWPEFGNYEAYLNIEQYNLNPEPVGEIYIRDVSNGKGLIPLKDLIITKPKKKPPQT